MALVEQGMHFYFYKTFHNGSISQL